jgi:hypothetical protein
MPRVHFVSRVVSTSVYLAFAMAMRAQITTGTISRVVVDPAGSSNS